MVLVCAMEWLPGSERLGGEGLWLGGKGLWLGGKWLGEERVMVRGGGKSYG